MTLQTRYRDIPWEEARKCQPVNRFQARHWEAVRGRPIVICTPPQGEAGPDVICEGPFYRLATLDGAAGRIVCPHIAVIGD